MKEIEQLQEKIAYQELSIEQLNDALSEQQQQLSRLQEELTIVTQLLRQMRNDNQQQPSSSTDALEYEIPPHY